MDPRFPGWQNILLAPRKNESFSKTILAFLTGAQMSWNVGFLEKKC